MGRKGIIAIVIIVVIGCVFLYFNKFKNQSYRSDTIGQIPDSVLFTSAPVLIPEQAIQTIQLPENFRIEIVASEPLIQDPIAMTFDSRGRIWVVEMQSYMQDLKTNREGEKISRIVILEDKDGDGRMDDSKVFLDSLVMPRAITLVNDGVLYAEPPNLWFVENMNDRPGRKQLVDSTYAVGGNPEHQPNGLLRGVDNWYYNAKSKYRYKYQEGKWIKEETEFRGQWGIAMDNYGRLFYNTNSNQLRGDLVPPNYLSRNPDYEQETGINVEIAKNQDVFPIRPTKGINRGYQEGMLDDANKLRQFTAACSPLIYRGDQFPDDFKGNAFVCEPSANLIKRNMLIENGPYVAGKQAYENKEFLASKDERFRPVSLNNGPDGNLYIVDMYRGVIQHEFFLTDYLRSHIKRRVLEKPVGLGRIYRIVYEGAAKTLEGNSQKEDKRIEPDGKYSNESLIFYLSHPNGWWRDHAQQQLVERKDTAIVPELIALLEPKKFKNYNQIHALWVLEGLNISTPEIIEMALQSDNSYVQAAAIRVGEQNSKGRDARKTLALYESVVHSDKPVLQLQLALSLRSFLNIDSTKVMNLLKTIVNKYGNEPLFLEAIISSLYQQEADFLQLLNEENPQHQEMVHKLLEVMETKQNKKEIAGKELSPTGKQQYLKGEPLYESTCSGCHGVNGEGLVPIAPPLKRSEWILGPESRLISIVLHGLTGPITVDGKVYKEPQVQPFMPGLGDNKEIDDKELAALLTYIRNSWGNNSPEVRDSTVAAVRKRTIDRREPYTQKELLKIQ